MFRSGLLSGSQLATFALKQAWPISALTTATRMYREMGMTYWLEQAEVKGLM